MMAASDSRPVQVANAAILLQQVEWFGTGRLPAAAFLSTAPSGSHTGPDGPSQEHPLPLSVAAFSGAKRATHVSGTFCYYISGRSKLSGQMLSCKAAQGKDLPEVQHGL